MLYIIGTAYRRRELDTYGQAALFKHYAAMWLPVMYFGYTGINYFLIPNILQVGVSGQ